jgi:hypothetical protein
MSQSSPPPPVYDDFPQDEALSNDYYHPFYYFYSLPGYETHGGQPPFVYYDFDQNQFPQGYYSQSICSPDSPFLSDQQQSREEVKHGMSKYIYEMENTLNSTIAAATPYLKKVEHGLCSAVDQINQSFDTFFGMEKK